MKAQDVQNRAQSQRGQAALPPPATQQAAAGEAQQPKQIQIATQAAAGAGVLKEGVNFLALPTRVQMALSEARSLMAKDAKGENVKKSGARVFYRTAICWVDAESVSHPDAPAREITRDSGDYGNCSPGKRAWRNWRATRSSCLEPDQYHGPLTLILNLTLHQARRAGTSGRTDLCRAFGARFLAVPHPGLTAGPIHWRPFGPPGLTNDPLQTRLGRCNFAIRVHLNYS